MKLLLIVLFLLSAMAFGENQVKSEAPGVEISQDQEQSPQAEACAFLSGLWYFTKLYTYNELICPQIHTDGAEIEQCVWDEMKTYFSSPDAMETYFEPFNFLGEGSISSSAGALIGNLEDAQAKQCGDGNENMGAEEVKKLLNCGLQVINNKRAELKCRW